MKKVLGVVAAACLLAAVGCGGDEEVKLEGPATLTSVQDCIEKSGQFPYLKATEDFGDGDKLLQGSYQSEDPFTNRFIMTFFLTERMARAVIESEYAFDEGTNTISIIADTPTIGLTYDDTMPDQGLATLKLCTKEDY